MHEVLKTKEVEVKTITKTSQFAANLIEARKRKGLTQKQLANIIGLKGHTAIVSYEQNGHFPPLDRFISICIVLETTPNWLLNYPDNDDLLDEFREENKRYQKQINKLELYIEMLKDENLSRDLDHIQKLEAENRKLTDGLKTLAVMTARSPEWHDKIKQLLKEKE